MYAVAIFTLTLLVTIGQFYSHSVDAVARRLGGAAALEVTSDATRPVPARDVTEMPGVTRVTAASTIDAQLQDGPSSAPVPVSIVGFDRSFVAHGAPAVAHGSGDSLFASVARDPTKVIVGTDLRSDLQSGLPGRPVRVGDSVEVRDALTGATRTLIVAGLVEPGRAGRAPTTCTRRGPSPTRSQGVRRPRTSCTSRPRPARTMTRSPRSSTGHTCRTARTRDRSRGSHATRCRPSASSSTSARDTRRSG